jgi:geranylgeranylglycerol-phosphate geranylgeranyltransferase
LGRLRTWTFLELARPLNVLLALLTVAVSFLLLRWIPDALEALLCLLSVAAIITGGNVLNDYFDRDVDRIAHPHRPIPRRKVEPRTAAVFGTLGLCAGPLLSIPLGSLPFAIALAASFVLYLYNRCLKGIPFLGNLSVALLSGAVFLYVASASGRTLDLLWPGLLAFLFHLLREIIKDMEDVRADRAHGLHTLPSVLGERKTLRLIRGLAGGLAFATLLPYLAGTYGELYLAVVIVSVDLPLVLLVLRLRKGADSVAYGRVSRFMKYDIFLALLALYLGGV